MKPSQRFWLAAFLVAMAAAVVFPYALHPYAWRAIVGIPAVAAAFVLLWRPKL